jgi:hypothetical protein
VNHDRNVDLAEHAQSRSAIMAYQTPSALPSQHTASILNLNVIKPSALHCASKICTERGYAHTLMSTRTKEASDNRNGVRF